MNYRGNKIVGIRKMAARRLERDICSFRLKSCKEIRGGGRYGQWIWDWS